MTFGWKAIALACAVFLGGCYDTRTTHPIGTTSALARDNLLIGIWKDDMWRQDAGEYLHIFPTYNGQMTALWIEAPKGKDHGSYTELCITTAKLGKNRFINAVEKCSNGESDRNWRPLFYTLRNDGRTLTIYTADDDKVVAAIESHSLTGHVAKHQDKDENGNAKDVIDSIEITAEPTELDEFMAKPEAAGLFHVFMVFRKIE